MDYELVVDSYGYNSDDGYAGLLPIVCLKSEVQLNKKSDGTYTLSLPE